MHAYTVDFIVLFQFMDFFFVLLEILLLTLIEHNRIGMKSYN